MFNPALARGTGMLWTLFGHTDGHRLLLNSRGGWYASFLADAPVAAMLPHWSYLRFLAGKRIESKPSQRLNLRFTPIGTSLIIGEANENGPPPPNCNAK